MSYKLLIRYNFNFSEKYWIGKNHLNLVFCQLINWKIKSNSAACRRMNYIAHNNYKQSEAWCLNSSQSYFSTTAILNNKMYYSNITILLFKAWELVPLARPLSLKILEHLIILKHYMMQADLIPTQIPILRDIWVQLEEGVERHQYLIKIIKWAGCNNKIPSFLIMDSNFLSARVCISWKILPPWPQMLVSNNITWITFHNNSNKWI